MTALPQPLLMGMYHYRLLCCGGQARMKARPPLAVSSPSTVVSAPPPPTSSYVVQGQNGVVSPTNYTVSSATVGPLTTPKCAYQLPAVQYIQHAVSVTFSCLRCVLSSTAVVYLSLTDTTNRHCSAHSLVEDHSYCMQPSQFISGVLWVL